MAPEWTNGLDRRHRAGPTEQAEATARSFRCCSPLTPTPYSPSVAVSSPTRPAAPAGQQGHIGLWTNMVSLTADSRERREGGRPHGHHWPSFPASAHAVTGQEPPILAHTKGQTPETRGQSPTPGNTGLAPQGMLPPKRSTWLESRHSWMGTPFPPKIQADPASGGKLLNHKAWGAGRGGSTGAQEMPGYLVTKSLTLVTHGHVRRAHSSSDYMGPRVPWVPRPGLVLVPIAV